MPMKFNSTKYARQPIAFKKTLMFRVDTFFLKLSVLKAISSYNWFGLLCALHSEMYGVAGCWVVVQLLWHAVTCTLWRYPLEGFICKNRYLCFLFNFPKIHSFTVQSKEYQSNWCWFIPFKNSLFTLFELFNVVWI